MNSATSKRVNSRQKEFLLDSMEKEYGILYGKFKNDHGDETKNKVWANLSLELNKLGPPQKDASKWKKVSFSLANIRFSLILLSTTKYNGFRLNIHRFSMICG